MGVHYRRDGIATFDATTDRIFRYMSSGNHPHAAFKSHRLVGVSDNVVTVDAEIYTPMGDQTKLDLEGEFPAMPGMTETDELKMIDEFFTMVFAEDTATLRTWSPPD